MKLDEINSDLYSVFWDGHWVQGHLGNLPNLGNLPDLGAEKYRKVPKNAEKMKSPRIFILFLGHALGGGLNRWCVSLWVSEWVEISTNFSIKTVYIRTSYNCLIQSLQESFSKLNFSGFRTLNHGSMCVSSTFHIFRLCAPHARGHMHVLFYEGMCPRKLKNWTGHGQKAAALWPITTYTKFGHVPS